MVTVLLFKHSMASMLAFDSSGQSLCTWISILDCLVFILVLNVNHCLHYEIGCITDLVDIFLEPEDRSWLLSWVIISENSLLTEVNMIAIKKN